jgi:carbamate kinase
MLVVVAFGANALAGRNESLDAEVARRNVKVAVTALAEIAREHQLVITHGNGPHIGLLAVQSEEFRDVRTYPLDVLGTEREGMIGCLLEDALDTELGAVPVASLMTQTVVDALDPAFRSPSKPIGPAYTADRARALAQERGWSIANDDDDEWRRVVATPRPRSIVELPTIRLLLEHGFVVVCAGGGGVPVVVDSMGARHSVDAVVDNDLAGALLARQLDADLLLLLTDVATFDAGSMAPKIEAAASFARTTGKRAMIGAVAELAGLVDGTAGTCIVDDEHATSDAERGR